MDAAVNVYEACFTAFDLERCQYVLDHPHEEEAYLFISLLNAGTVVPNLLRCVRSQRGSINLRDTRMISLLKKLMAYSIETFHSSLDNQARVTACRAIILLLSLQSSSAFGLSNSNIIHFLLATLVKFITGQLQLLSKDILSNRKTKGSSYCAQLNVTDDNGNKVGASRSSKRVAANNSHSSHPKVVVDKGEANSDSDTEDALDCDESMPMTSEGAPSIVVERLRCDLLRVLVDDLSSHSELFTSPTDDHDLNLSAELLLDMMFVCSMGREYAASRELCTEMFVGFAVARTATLSSSYRALLSILVMSPRGSSLPDAFKTKKSCHAIAMSALLRLISASCVGDTATRLTLTLQAESLLPVDIEGDNSATEDAEAVDPPSADESSTPITSYPHMCLVGVLQRITLACPDKVPVRQLLSGCITDLLSCMQRVIEDCDRGDDNKQSAENMRRCVSHYLTFLSRLTKSSKTTHRAFSVDIAGLIITANWIWQQLSMQQTDSEEETPASTLLEAVLGRCGDSAPAVRVRAVSVLIDLFSHVSTNDASLSPAMETTVHAMLFSSGPIFGCMKRSSLLDVLRDRASDEKIQVSSKAMQALSFVLSTPWTSSPITTDGAVVADAVHLSITDEDLQLFASKCADSSITVRKQAVSSLTELLLARPSDALIQDVWLQSILPMAYDPESTIVNKAAELMHRVLFNGLLQWSHTKKEQLDDVSLVWRLISKLASMGLLKLFKAAVGAMLKHGYLSVTASKSNNQSSSVLEVMSIIKGACCFELDASYSMDQSPTHRGGHSFTTMRGYCDADEVVRSAWVLMEALVSLEHVSVAGDKQQQQRFGDVLRSTGSADFVVKCFRVKHGRAGGDEMDDDDDDDDDTGGGASLHCDDDDVRMFRVLQTLSHNLEACDVEYMRAQCLRCLEGLQFDCHVAGSAVSLLLQLSKVSSRSSSGSSTQMGSSTSSKHPSALKDIVQSWADQLVSSATVALRCYVYRDLSPPTAAARGGVGAALISRLHRYLSSTVDGEGIDMDIEDASILPSIQAALFIIGEVAMLGFSMEEDQTKGSLGDGTATVVSDHFKLAVSDEVVNFVKILMGNQLPVIKNDALKPIIVRQCAQKLRASAFVTMGKLCMRDKSLARSQVNIFLREVAQTTADERGSGNSCSSSHLVNLSSLCGDSSMVRDSSSEDRQSSVVRSNALLVLGDMCIRYTNLVDRHVDTMSMCLQDSDSMVRKNALIILTQLLLQDFLKWKGFLLYRFLLLCIDADFEIAQFARNLLQKTLNAKFPQLLSNHFSEAVVILNGCIHHQIYHSVVRTNLNVVNGIDRQSSIDPKQSDGGGGQEEAGFFSIRLSATQRFEIYSFMAESLDDESRIQVSAKLVQDVLSHAVDHPSVLKMDSHPSMLKMDSHSKTKRSGSGLNPSEAAIDDVFQLLKSPFLKICQKRSGAAAVDDDVQGSEDLLDDGPGLSSQGTAKATFAQAKSKVLKKLSSKHLITHILPVVMSLKHVLEASNSPLQGPLMEYLVYLMKQHRPEVDEALQFDPTLKAEIEYDLKQYEKNKRDSSNHSPRLSVAADGASASTGPVGMLSSDRLPTGTIVKPVLRKSLGGSEGRGRTPSEALKSPGLHLGSNLIYSVMKTDRSSKGGAAGMNDDEDDLHRLTFSTSISDPTDLELMHRRDSSLGGLDAFYPDGGMKISPIKQQQKQQKQSRRRSWSVVVNSLLPSGAEGPTKVSASSEVPALSQPQRVTPAKKIRIRKSKSPQALGPNKKSPVDGVPALHYDDAAATECVAKANKSSNSSSNSSSSDGENIVPSMNRLNIATGTTNSTGCASLLGMIVAATQGQHSLQPSVRPIKRPSGSSSRIRPGMCDSLLTLSK